MPLLFHPDAGTICICDFSTGFRPPEIVKHRPVIVVSPRRRHAELLTVIPLSSVAPRRIESQHVEVPEGDYPPARSEMWAKCDLVQTVGLARCDRVRTTVDGNRIYVTYQASAPFLEAVRHAVGEFLNIS